jgi:mannosylglycerate hydrolase
MTYVTRFVGFVMVRDLFANRSGLRCDPGIDPQAALAAPLLPSRATPSAPGVVSRLTGFIFHLIPHTHWDREWYLPGAAFQARLIPVLDDLIARLQRDPGYRSFLLDGQTVLVGDYLQVRPERDADIRALVKTGRLQVGPWFVLADELIPSGEALVRNLMLGAADAERLGGRSDVLYSPDAFGHPAVLPTLGREFGIKHGVVWRGIGGEAGEERDTYCWRGPDGKDILLWQLPPAGYEVGAALPADPDRLPAAWAAVRGALVSRAAGNHVAVFVGADHHAAHPDVPRLRDLLAELEPESAFRVSRLDEFCRGAEVVKPPVLSGELRWSYRYAWTLQGVHGTRAPLKRRNSELELWLERFAEPVAALARRAGGRDRRPLLDHAWRTLLSAQFHDVLAGCVSDVVAQAVAARHDAVEAMARELVRDSIRELVQHDPDAVREQAAPRPPRPSLVVWNPATRARGGVTVADLTLFRRAVRIGPPSRKGEREGPGYTAFGLAPAAGPPIGVQVLGHAPGLERLEASRHYPDLAEVVRVRVAFRAPPVPGLGLSVWSLAEPHAIESEDGVAVRGRTVVNRFVEVALDATGALTLSDRRTGERFNDLFRLEDQGDAGDAYSFCPVAGDRVIRASAPIKVRRLASGPLVAALEARFGMTAGGGVARERAGRVGVRLVVTLHADSPVVRCVLEVDNQATNHRLRVRLPTALIGMPAVAGTAFGVIARTPVVVDRAAYPLETPVLTAPAHRFVAVARGHRGLALFAPGFFEYEWTPQGDLLLTLLRAVGELSRGDLPTRPGHAAWPTATPGAQCVGMTRIEVALALVSAPEIERGDVLPALWEDCFVPLRGFWLRDAVQLTPAAVDTVLEGTGLVLSAVKPAQAGSPIVLRCYNATGAKVAGAWRFGDAVRTAHRVRADERESVPLVLEGRGHRVRFVAEPHEIVTILVT